jgi:hypothetical protein
VLTPNALFPIVELLQAVVNKKEDFVLEVTDRHVTDVTGSILVAELGQTRLLETSQIPQVLVSSLRPSYEPSPFSQSSFVSTIHSVPPNTATGIPTTCGSRSPRCTKP